MSDPILEGAIKIRKLLADGKPFFIGRNGTIEIETLFFWKLHRPARPYPEYMREQIQRNAGIFPATEESLDRWCAEYTQGLSLMNGGAAGWYPPTAHIEKRILDHHAPTAFRTPLRSLEPYYVEAGARWTEKLAGKKVTVVSSFTDTIQQQLKRPIWPNGLLGRTRHDHCGAPAQTRHQLYCSRWGHPSPLWHQGAAVGSARYHFGLLE